MLRLVLQKDSSLADGLFDDNRFQNPYFLINLETYGCCGDNISLWALIDDGVCVAGLYCYYDSVQLAETKVLGRDEAKLIADYAIQNSIQMISGSCSTLRAIEEFIPDATVTQGELLSLNCEMSGDSSQVEVATWEEMGKIAELICADDSIGSHYTVESLTRQLEERMERFGCRSHIVKEGDRVISHMATYAEGKQVAVLGGLVTDPRARGKGFARSVLKSLSSAVLSEEKMPLLYCYKDTLIDWYKLLGWKSVLECAKLEIPRGDK